MLHNYFLVAIRNLFRRKVSTLVNVSGLSLGICAALVIFLVVQFEYSFDRFHPYASDTYRVVIKEVRDGDAHSGAEIPLPMIGAAGKEMTGIEKIVPMILWDVQHPSANRQGIIFTSNAYFDVTPYQWLAGSSATALLRPGEVVLTWSRAQQYFPGVPAGSVIGRTVTYFDSIPLTVTGIVADLRENTDFIFQEFLSVATMHDARLAGSFPLERWGTRSSDYELLLRLSAGYSPAQVESQLKQLISKYDPEANMGQRKTSFFLEPIEDIHLNNEYGSFYSVRHAHKDGLVGLSLMGMVLLVLACINFINLTTAQATKRAREIGIRKTIGGSRKQLIGQFLCETLTLTVFAAGVALLLLPLVLQFFAPFLPPGLHFSWGDQPEMIAFLLMLVLSVGLISGFYPAIVLSAFDPVRVLKGPSAVASQKTGKAWLRRTLSVTQFVIAQLFLIITLAIAWQINRLLTQEPGFRKEAVVFFSVPNKNDSVRQQRWLLANRLGAIPGIQRVSLSAEPPCSSLFSAGVFTYIDGQKEVEANVTLKFVDTNYLGLYGISLVSGTNVHASDTMREMVINETYARLLGFSRPQDAVNQAVYAGTKGQTGNRMTIVGVMKDFHTNPLLQKTGPVALTAAAKECYTIHVALQPQRGEGRTWSSTIGQMEKTFRELYPQSDLDYRFLDESLAAAYRNMGNMSHLLMWATGVSIFISCLGMLGLVIYTTDQRTKEIGIRKVMGASVRQVVLLLSGEFIRMVILATVIATPAAMILIYKWLERFSDRGLPPAWLFPLAAIGMIGLTLLILSLQTMKAARANPVDSLRID